MKKPLILPALKAFISLLLLCGLIYPQSVVASFIVIWALFCCLACFVASLTGAAASEYWLTHGREGSKDSFYAALIACLIFFHQPPAWRKFWSLLILGFTFPCLLSGGAIFTALFYLLCLAGFWAVRSSYRKRIEEGGLCQKSC